MISICGVICSDCPAYHAAQKGVSYQNDVVEAWHRIYGLIEITENIRCGGCLGSNDELFYTSLNCKARHCCLSRGFNSCAECKQENCPDIEKAQSVWDEVPLLVHKLSAEEFEIYARPYCQHRERLVELRKKVL